MAKKQRSKQQKDSPDLIKARDSWERRRFSEALRRFDKAVRRQPDHPMALIDAARAFGARFQAEKAVKILQRLEKIGARDPEILVEAAQAYKICHRSGDATRCLEQVLAGHPDHAGANYELALVREAGGDIVSAREHVERSLHSHPDSDPVKILHARLLAQLGDNDFAYAVLLELSEPGVRPLVRSEALSMIARIHESEGDFDDAFLVMMESNQALDRISTKAREQADALEPVLMHLRNAVKPTHLRKWAKLKEEAGLESPPLALMTAPYRSGGTLISRLLATHSGIAVADNIAALSEEIFPAALMAGDDAPSSKSTELFKGMEPARRQAEAIRYRELLRQCLPEGPTSPELLIDHSPSITPLIPSFLRVVPRGKIIVPIRDPRDILVSSLFAHFPPERDTVAFSHPFDATERIAFELDTWQHFRQMLAPEQYTEVRYEALVENPETTIHELEQSLGVGGRVQGLPILHDHSVGRWQHYQDQLGSYYEELAPLVESLGYR